MKFRVSVSVGTENPRYFQTYRFWEMEDAIVFISKLPEDQRWELTVYSDSVITKFKSKNFQS